MEFFSSSLIGSELVALATVVLIDLVLAGDNAIVVGMAAAGLPRELRRKAIILGIGAAAALRILFALFATKLLGVIGLTLAGGILLLWVCWKLWRELRSQAHQDEEAELLAAAEASASRPGGKTLGQALRQIIIADVSMSLDNVLAVAGTAREHTWVLIVGLVLSVALMGVAANFVANVLKRAPWIAYVGLAVIAYVALRMIWDGGLEMFHFADAVGAI
ncbi:YjbE family integral membrane protein [Kaistia hirudinis]|uniref:YjbE family integral membrane protein n=1 Tax=Kaistia hirudinis TaxID=1293440 RepID=A0A840AXK2_9HYPH|nr:TerC family protein [Kaistia hirudinis]MBB3933205.1 YjbE family integral membrane protein [Kaistia hirudinis]MBN9019833.1 TerC family protein [Hyphomicrobiales bacterium]